MGLYHIACKCIGDLLVSIHDHIDDVIQTRFFGKRIYRRSYVNVRIAKYFLMREINSSSVHLAVGLLTADSRYKNVSAACEAANLYWHYRPNTLLQFLLIHKAFYIRLAPGATYALLEALPVMLES